MNASYKIVLLGAFVLFAAVLGYVVLSGDPPTDQANAQNPAPLANNTPGNTPTPQPDRQTPPHRESTPPSGRRTLENPPRPEPDNVVTIDTPGTPDVDVILGPVAEAPGPDGTGNLRTPTGLIDRSIGTDTPDRERIGPGTESPDTPGPGPADPDTTDTDIDTPEPTRPGPGTDTTDTPDTPEQPRERGPEPEAPAPVRIEPPTPPRTTEATPRTYTVQPGDTFASIAVKVYGEEQAWFDIAQANPSVDPKRLQVDQVIVLPKRGVTEREEATPPAPGRDQSYTVRPGDNLSKIAKKFYNDTEAWDLIYNRNRDKIGPRPDQLKVGMVLVIPQAYNGAE